MDDLRKRLARAISPEWFGESATVLANYPGQEKHYQDRALKQADSVLAEIDAAGLVIVERIPHEGKVT